MAGGIVFLVGLGGLVFSGVFFFFESRRGTRVFSDVRTSADRVVSRLYRTLVFGEIPHAYRESILIQVRVVTQKAVHTLVVLLRALERPLSRMSHRMTRSVRVHKNQNSRTPSPFLKDIADYQQGDGKKTDTTV